MHPLLNFRWSRRTPNPSQVGLIEMTHFMTLPYKFTKLSLNSKLGKHGLTRPGWTMYQLSAICLQRLLLRDYAKWEKMRLQKHSKQRKRHPHTLLAQANNGGSVPT